MHRALWVLLLMCASPAWAATGQSVDYQVNGQAYQGYYVSPGGNAPLHSSPESAQEEAWAGSTKGNTSV